MLSGSRDLVPLSGRPEVLVDLSWRHPPGLDAIDFLGSPHWLCPVIVSLKGKVQPYLWLSVTALDNVIVYRIRGEDEQLWHPSSLDSLPALTLNICY